MADRFLSLDFLRWQHEEKKCIGCGATPIECHHVISRKRKDGSDLRAVPLCHRCHQVEGPKFGWEKFQTKHGIEFESVSRALVAEFLAQYNVSFPEHATWEEIEQIVTEANLATGYTTHRRVNRGSKKPRKSRRKNRQPFPKYQRPW